ncbi:hypothetical protein BDK51DRAFT_4355, partial [Blyttiomyces helicus]
GTKLPMELVILHEFEENYSIQCTLPMTLDELNHEITRFLQQHGEKMSPEEFFQRYPVGT